MLRLLLQLWARQKRRDFRWGRFLGQAYFCGLLMTLITAVTVVAYEELGGGVTLEVAIPFLAVMMIAPDFLNKLVMKHDATVMDHYLKSRPIAGRDWNRFLLVTNLLNFWNWTVPVALLPFCCLFLPWTHVVPSVLLLAAVSMVNGVAVTTFRRAKGWTHKWPVLLAEVYWLLLALPYSLTVLVMPWGWHVAGFILLCTGAVSVFYHYLCSLRRYDESQARAGSLFLTRASSLFSMEYISVLRSKRLRLAVLVVPLVFDLNAYLESQNGLGVMFYVMLSLAIFGPSMMLGQWNFAIEGNYFDGLWTKPVSVGDMLRNKFWFYALLNTVAALLVVPLIWTAGLSPWMLLAMLVFIIGVVNQLLMPTCLISSRIELFQSAFFNYQGASMAVNLYGLVIFVPVVFCGLCVWLLPLTATGVILFASGAAGMALQPVITRWLARQYHRRRHVCFERYRQ